MSSTTSFSHTAISDLSGDLWAIAKFYRKEGGPVGGACRPRQAFSDPHDRMKNSFSYGKLGMRLSSCALSSV